MARPRSSAAHRAALDATTALLLEVGVEGTTIEEVAARSGVARSTVYRHFGSREELLAAAARDCVGTVATPDTGSLADDLRLLLARLAEPDEEQVSDLLPLLIDAASRDPRMDEVVRAVLEERRRPLLTVLRLAQLRGEVGADLELDTALAMVIGPLVYRRMVERRQLTPEFLSTTLAGSIAALRASAGGAHSAQALTPISTTSTPA